MIRLKHLICWLSSIVCLLPAQAQLLDSLALDSSKIYTEIPAAELTGEVYRLNLSKQKLQALPPGLSDLESLQALDLKKNRLQKAELESLRDLKSLQYINLSKNKLTTFPKALCELTNLEVLVINQNVIDSIPPCIQNLKKLRVLDMWSNELDYFPEELAQLPKLEIFDLQGILISEKRQQQLLELLPNTQVKMSPPCNCADQ